MYFINPSPLAKVFYSGKAIWKMAAGTKTLYLTFDDGPEPEVTLPVLEILEEFNIKATFFCVGENVFHHFLLFQSILKQGHHAGNHTYHHLNGWKTPTLSYLENVNQCRQLVDSDLFRPPFGKMKSSQISAISPHYAIINWSVLTYDFNPDMREDRCLKNCTENMKDGNIFVFHDSLKAKRNVLSVLPAFIETALEKGYKFGLIRNSLPVLN